MAFVRWRGHSAELLTTVYEQGRSRQLRLACLGGAYYVPPGIRAAVMECFPRIAVDWEAVDQALAAGPPHERAQAVEQPNDRLEWFQLEQRLRHWAAQTASLRPKEADRLRAAAAVLSDWRQAKPYFSPATASSADSADIAAPPRAGRNNGD